MSARSSVVLLIVLAGCQADVDLVGAWERTGLNSDAYEDAAGVSHTCAVQERRWEFKADGRYTFQNIEERVDTPECETIALEQITQEGWWVLGEPYDDGALRLFLDIEYELVVVEDGFGGDRDERFDLGLDFGAVQTGKDGDGRWLWILGEGRLREARK